MEKPVETESVMLSRALALSADSEVLPASPSIESPSVLEVRVVRGAEMGVGEGGRGVLYGEGDGTARRSGVDASAGSRREGRSSAGAGSVGSTVGAVGGAGAGTDTFSTTACASLDNARVGCLGFGERCLASNAGV